MVKRNSRKRQYCTFRIFYGNVSVNEARITFLGFFCCIFLVFFHVLMILFTTR
jgi:hypothetical protein